MALAAMLASVESPLSRLFESCVISETDDDLGDGLVVTCRNGVLFLADKRLLLRLPELIVTHEFVSKPTEHHCCTSTCRQIWRWKITKNEASVAVVLIGRRKTVGPTNDLDKTDKLALCYNYKSRDKHKPALLKV